MRIPNRDRWLVYATEAWGAAGRPEGLDPTWAESHPIRFDAAYYDYFERRFIDLWMKVYSNVKPVDGALIVTESAEFCDAWRRNFSWHTVWKQLLPLFVYGSAAGVTAEVLAEVASHYCMAQAVPSTVIDRILDEPHVGPPGAWHADAAYSLLFYIKGLAGIRALDLPCSAALEDCFVEHTGKMYDIMLAEHARRFVLPGPPLFDTIRNYFAPQSRLLSSIFFGVLPRWAYLLAGKDVPSNFGKSLDALRRVRQLNDELSDVYTDLARGLVTLPWLYGLDESRELRGLIEALWRQPEDPGAAEACRACLRTTNAMQRACSSSLDLLSDSMDATIASFPVGASFELTLLHNVRWAHVMRIVQNGFEDIPAPRQPLDPHRVLSSASNPITPVGGAGAVVVNADGKVLMALISKRGMLRWELPAGVAEGEESLERTAQRETLEETAMRVEIDEAVAQCWHYSRQLGKAWMGLFFSAHLSDPSSAGIFRVLKLAAPDYSKINLEEHRDLYESADVETFDFELLRRHWLSRTHHPTAHENVVACGFIDWTRVPDGRIHPLHRELLEALRLGRKVDLLVKDADTDIVAYDVEAPLYVV